MRLWCILILIGGLAVAGCGTTPPAPVPEAVRIKAANDTIIAQVRRTIRTGDLVLRTGNDFSSEQVKSISLTDKTYSHSGIASVEGDSVFVYHIEPDYHNVNDKVRKESLDSFCNPAKNLGIGVARYQLSSEEKGKFMTYLEQQFQNKVSFDMEFMLHTDDKLYCSEMIQKGLAKATDGRIVIQSQPFTDKSKYRLVKRYFKLKEKQFVNRQLIVIDQLYLNPHCNLLTQHIFERPL